MNEFINIKNCHIEKKSSLILKNINFVMNEGEAWLVTGHNGSGKADFIDALAGKARFVPDETAGGNYSNIFEKSTAVVSLEEAARLIQEERDRDETDYMDKEDEGRTGRQYICEVLGGSSKKGAPLPEIAKRLETMPQVKLCGVEKILDRGLRYMSTGEIRRTLLCRALLSNSSLIILSDPFAGLDAESRRILLEFFDSIFSRQIPFKEKKDFSFPRILLCMERFTEIPSSINRVIEFSNKEISFCGERSAYEKILSERTALKQTERDSVRTAFINELERIRKEYKSLSNNSFEKDSAVGTNHAEAETNELISFENVNVGWDTHRVLVNLNWKILKGEHWLIRGPNGSGKTTLLELITGDNMQVFRENVRIFGKRRGSGETIWDIKKKLGIVSYRLHVEYRMVGGTSLENVIISGFKDSIGLYEPPTDFQKATARAWLNLAGFGGRENENFSSLSYGEQRAILILRAAVKSPEVLILDEPCHGLDDNYRDKVLDLISTVASTGTTTLLHVTHDPAEVLECEKHILELAPNEEPMYKILVLT